MSEFTEVGKCIAESFKRQFNYLCCFNSDIQNLRDEVKKLDDAKIGLERQVEVARKNWEVVVPEVLTWLDDVNKILEDYWSGIERLSVQSDCLAIKSRFSLSRKATKMVAAMKVLQDDGKFGRISLRQVYELKSRKDFEEDIMATLREKKVSLMGIFGMAGVGKTTMAKKIMTRARDEDLFDEIVIAVVSQPVDMLRIQKEMAELLGLDLKVEGLPARAHLLRIRLMNTKSTLIILDDLWEGLNLEDLGIPKECTALLTSRNGDVFSAMNVEKTFQMKTLEDVEAWSLFKEKVGACADDQSLFHIAQEIVRECKGLPITIVTVALMMKYNRNKFIWEDAIHELRSSSPPDIPDFLASVYNPLKLSYDLLESKHAKSIFLICCLFPEDHNILISNLSFCAWGLGMFGGIRSLQDARNKVQTLVEMLKSRSLLLDGNNERYVKMHDVVRDVGIFIAAKEGLTDPNLNWKNWAGKESNYIIDCSWMSLFGALPGGSVFPNLRFLLSEGPSNFDERQSLYDNFESARKLCVLSIQDYEGMRPLPQTIQLQNNMRTLILCSSLEDISVLVDLKFLSSLTTLKIHIHDVSFAAEQIILHVTVDDDPEMESEVNVEHLPIPKAEKVFGREQEMRKLLLKCCNPDVVGIQLSAVPIVGAAGIGKTTLARLLYEDELVLKHFEMRVWVKMDAQEFNLHHAAQQILKSTIGMACSIDDLDELVQDTLLGRRCLIVFDGVESMTRDLWLRMNKYWFDSVDLGSIVLITTPSEGVANLVSNEAFELKQLLPDDGWSLYRYYSFDPAIVGEASRSIAALFGGNPLLLKLVGSVMRYDDKLRHLLSKANFSDVISLPTFDASVAIFLCVWALTPQLRQCLAFCAIFPEGYALDKEKIVNLWAAHGLVKPSPKNNLRDIGDSYFHQLLCRSFFTDIARNEYGDITEFRMPGLIHTVMQDVGSIVWKGKIGAIGSISEDADLLSVHLEGPEDVRTLILSSTLHPSARSLDYTFLYFRELESLDLSCSGIRNLSDDICSLTQLRYLNLSYTLIERLSDSIKGLPRLQTLDLSWCYHFKVLPRAICSLPCLSHLDLLQCESLSYLPYGIGSLTSLTSMPLFVLGKDHDCAGLEELGMFNQLRGRLEIRNLENVLDISEAHDAKLNQKQLHHLGLCWNKHVDPDFCFQVLKILQPKPQLKVVDITGYTGFRFPGWIPSMSFLIKISITDCGCTEMPSLGQLPLLKELQLKGMINIQYIGPEFYGDGVTNGAFPSLEQLGFYDMPKLLEWSGAMGSGQVFRSLKTLTIEGCPRLDNIPTFRNPLDLIVCNSNDGILSSWNKKRFGSPSSLLVKDMALGMKFDDLMEWRSLKKLILVNSTWNLIHSCLGMMDLIGLEHLSIAHCPQVRVIVLGSENSFQKLHFVDCPNLERIYSLHEATKLTELVVDGCPNFFHFNAISDLDRVTKLIIRGSGKFIMATDFKALVKLEYLSISECPLLEKELEMEPSLISHIPCVLLANRKVSFNTRRIPKISEAPPIKSSRIPKISKASRLKSWRIPKISGSTPLKVIETSLKIPPTSSNLDSTISPSGLHMSKAFDA